ncbi:hypothetical protein GCM10007108_02210 [Thermogymnomonas acidicola]|uniref:YdbS-like PH domain-containing protein n=1 Tax=Thermogymnomonas acidicola TaxID=399579 RepID=A0AA37F8R6_9ARCH|nr:PH domain-containing protein [Thermogymnomonas acidicola]GGM67735.1 hypothetical protein GCM10007108_02210 [Thermogymnomonas acidicola]
MPWKTLIKGTILVAIFSIFLDISRRTFISYLEFLGVTYLLLAIYIWWKTTVRVIINSDQVEVKSFLSTKRFRISDIQDLFYNQGILQRKFDLISIYVITKRGNILIKDLRDGRHVYEALDAAYRANHAGDSTEQGQSV